MDCSLSGRKSPGAMLVAFLGLLSSLPATAASPSKGCGNIAPMKLDTLNEVNLTLPDSQGGKRRYLYWLPPSYHTQTPSSVVFSFHGAKQSAELQSKTDYFTNPFFNPNSSYIIVYPEATFAKGTKDRYWQVGPEQWASGIDDIGYVQSVLDDVTNTVCVDENRIYSTGMSQGGGMTNMLACNATTSKRFAAYAPVSGAFYYPFPSAKDKECHPKEDKLPCSPGRADIPILAFHGADDQTIPYDGGERKGACTPDIPYWAEQWALRNGLNVSGMTTTTAASMALGSEVGVVQTLGGTAEHYSYGKNITKGLVQLIMDGDNVEHIWPTTFSRLTDDGVAVGDGPTTFNASNIIMDFFGRYTLSGPVTTLPVDSSTDSNSTTTTSPSASPSPTSAAFSSFTASRSTYLLALSSMAFTLLN